MSERTKQLIFKAFALRQYDINIHISFRSQLAPLMFSGGNNPPNQL